MADPGKVLDGASAADECPLLQLGFSWLARDPFRTQPMRNPLSWK
jgi:hypothetical protein